MTGIVPLPSVSHAPVPAVHDGAPRARGPQPPDDPTADSKAVNDEILLKISLEGKDFQTARREALEDQAAEPEAHDPPQAATPNRDLHPTPEHPGEELEIEASHVTVDLQSGDTSVHVEFTRVSISVTEGPRPQLPPRQPRGKDPLVLDFEGDGPSTTGADGARPFDLQGDGDQRATSFVKGASAFLALDRDGNGRIDDGSELFGDQHGARDGFEELAKFDANGDHIIDVKDPVYSRLELLYGDGRRESLSAEGVTSISLDASAQDARTSTGDDLLAASIAGLQGGGRVGVYAMGLQRFDTTG